MKKLLTNTWSSKYLINRLMSIYSRLIIGILLFVAVCLCLFIAEFNKKTTLNYLDKIDQQLTSRISTQDSSMSYIYMDLVGSSSSLENLRQYMLLSTEDYFHFTDKAWQMYQVDQSVYSKLNGIFQAFPDLKELYIKLNDVSIGIEASQLNKSGSKITYKFQNSDGILFKRTINNPISLEAVGEIYAVFSTESAVENIESTMETENISLFLFDTAGVEMFKRVNGIDRNEASHITKTIKETQKVPNQLKKNYYVKQNTTSSEVSFLLLTSSRCLMMKNMKLWVLVILVTLILAFFLLVTLKKTFKRYTDQVGILVNYAGQIGKGEFSTRLDTTTVQEELNDLATAMNFMGESLEKYIEDNFRLEIQQREAHMKALQSQINPHFLYNTLEYIRMYALNQDQEELADVVFAFSSLLRNNTTQERVTTLAKELLFCEKYIYLYQMRYPDRVAYHITIEPELKELKIPKFSIQPLIENYFVHGINYNRIDNAIRVQAYQENEFIIIEIKDNGVGIERERLLEIRERLTSKKEQSSESIGLSNVYERFNHFFEGQLEMTIESKPTYEGTLIRITIKKDRGESVV